MIKILQGKDREKKSIRAEYGKTLVELGKKNPNIVALDADLSCSTQTAMFGKEFPERFFNMGIAEQDAMEIYVDGASVVLRKYEETCIFCGSSQDILSYREKNVCLRCLHSLQSLG